MIANAVPAGVPIPILGVPFDKVTMTEAIASVEDMIASRQPHYLVTPNVDFVVQAQSDVELRRILFDADLVVCDGTPLAWVSRLLKHPLPERVAGADLVPQLIRIAAEKGYRIFLLGASPEAAATAAENLQRKYPGLAVNYYSPAFKHLLEMDHPEITRRIREARPDLLLVSFGCPKQEKWIAMHYRSLGVPVCAGVGATIDFLAGRMKRAPVWMRRSGTEWIFRMLQEPRRLFKRYARDLWVFGWKILTQCYQFHFRESPSGDFPTDVTVRAEPDWLRITLPERLDHTTVSRRTGLVEHASSAGKPCLVDMTQLRHIDSAGVGLLVRLHKNLHARNRQLILLAPGKRIRHALSVLGLENFFLSAPDLPAAQSLIDTCAREQNGSVVLRTEGTTQSLHWRGEITAANAEQVWRATRAHLDNSPPQREWLLDLSRVRFMESSGVGVLLLAKQLAQRKQFQLSLVNLPHPVRNVLQHARFEALLSRWTNRESAEPAETNGLILTQEA